MINDEKDNQFIGKVFSTNGFGDFVVLRRIYKIDPDNPKNQSRRWYEIEFLQTGYKTVTRSDNIQAGKIRDLFLPTIAGVGFTGGRYNVRDIKYKYLYLTWVGMLHRCYDPTDVQYSRYGAIGVRVDPRWHEFGKFYEDAIRLPGYEMKEKYPYKYSLDKDYLQSNIPTSQRVYSKDTCIWISDHDNLTIMAIENKQTLTGYHGVDKRKNRYRTRIADKLYGSFNCPEAAANLYNYLRPVIYNNEHCTISIVNDVVHIPLDELPKYHLGDPQEILDIIQFIKNHNNCC